MPQRRYDELKDYEFKALEAIAEITQNEWVISGTFLDPSAEALLTALREYAWAYAEERE